jgi:phosphoglycerol transferase MdoB-like AlkP superfamily enzyme
MKEKIQVVLKRLQPLKPKISHPMLQCLWISLALNLFIEIMSRRSIFDAIGYLFTNPLVFLYNSIIILTTISFALFFKRRTFAFSMISVIWIAIGITDFVLLQFRTTPFTATDLKLIKSAIDIWDYYLKFYHIILIVIGIILLVFGGFVIFKKSKKYPRNLSIIKLILFPVVTIISAFALTYAGLGTGLLAKNFGNLANAFHSYGLPYCFVSSIINTGVDKPDIYTPVVVDTIVDAVEEGKVVYSSDITPTQMPEPTPTIEPTFTPSPTPSLSPSPSVSPSVPTSVADEKTPNIIFLQLESFFDPTRIIGTQYTMDPISTFRSLKENYSSGYLSVPSVGAGTANTEFEVLTGINLDFFGPGEYPYKTILQDNTCESISYNLKPLGYSTHAMHNNTGTFYDRNLVFSHLGFDTFTSVEYMQNVEVTPTKWAKDAILVPEIEKVLDSTPNQDLIYTISVQGHGSYPDTAVLENPLIDVTLSEDLSDSLYYPLLYYVNQIYEMDQFIKKLTEELSKRDEKTILVMYGDHLPGFQIDETNLTDGNQFNSEYIIWSNYDLDVVDHDIEAYQLTATVLDKLDIHEGLITKLHQTQKDSDIYLDELQVLTYDMLYGDMECFNGVNPYVATDLKMGTDEIVIYQANFVPSTVKETDGLLVVNGANFTPYSKVLINDEIYDTMFVNSSMIVAVISEDLFTGKLNVIQSGSDMYELSRTKDFIIPEKE